MQQLGARLAAHGEARAARMAGVREGSAMLWTPAELDNQIAQLQRGIARRKQEIADMEPRAGWGPGYARALSEKRAALAYHERELETIRAQRAEWGKGSAARAASGIGRYRFVTTCISSTYEDISAMKETATEVSRATFARALGPESWAWVQKSLGYDRDFRISGDWHVGYDKGTYRGVPAYWLTHSAIEWIFTLDGEQGKSRARRGSRSALSDERLLKLACVGMCGEFAAALHREFGYPLGAFYEVGPDGWKAGDYTLLHAFAYHPSGKLVDSKGVRSKAQMKSELYTMDGGKVKEAKTTEGDLDALSMEGLDTEVLEAARSYLQRNRAAFDADAGRAARRGSRALDFDFFEDEPEPQASPETRARRAFEAAAGALPETIDASDLFRAWPEGVDERVLIVQRYVRGAVPGWFVYAPSARTEAEAQRLGARLHKALVAPRSLRADQPRLHELPLTVGWPGGTVGVGAAR
jgi:hypothetical protein